MGVERVGNEDVVECFAFLADLGLGVAVEGFELVIDVVLKILLGVGIKFHFFGEDEDAARLEAIIYTLDQLVSFDRVEELEGVVHNDDRCVFDFYIGDVGKLKIDWRFAEVAVENIGGAGDHSFRVVDGDDLTAGSLDAMAESDGAGTKRTA